MGALTTILALNALWTLFSHMDNHVGSASPFPTPDEGPSTSTFNVLRVVGEGEPTPEVGDIIVLPPGVDTDEEKLAYLQSLGNTTPSPSPTPSQWPAAALPPGHIPVEEYLESRGIDPEDFVRELHKGEESVQAMIERLATK